MATIDLITYDQKMVTPKDDALIHQFGISNGVLYGCDVTLSDSNTLHITGGQGVIYGRQWEITEGDITVTLPASGSLKGRLYVKIDLSNTTNPIELLVQTDVTLPDLTDDDQINVNNSVSELELYTFDVSSLTISNLVKTVETVADGDHADVVQMQNDISQLNSSIGNWVDISNQISVPSGTDKSFKYCVVGNIVFMRFYINQMSFTANQNIWISLPNDFPATASFFCTFATSVTNIACVFRTGNTTSKAILLSSTSTQTVNLTANGFAIKG